MRIFLEDGSLAEYSIGDLTIAEVRWFLIETNNLFEIFRN
jgi:hypothetical protein